MFNCLKAAKSLKQDSLPLTTRFPRISGARSINLGIIKYLTDVLWDCYFFTDKKYSMNFPLYCIFFKNALKRFFYFCQAHSNYF